MSRYFVKSAHIASPSPDGRQCDWYTEDQHSITVHEHELETWTGLYDEHGMEIHRCEKGPLGFLPGRGS